MWFEKMFYQPKPWSGAYFWPVHCCPSVKPVAAVQPLAHAGAGSLAFPPLGEILHDLGFVLAGCHFARLIDTRGSLNGPGTSPELSQLISVWQE